MNESQTQPMTPRQAFLLGAVFFLALGALVAIAGFPALGRTLRPADASDAELRNDEEGGQDEAEALRPLVDARYAADEVEALERAVDRALAPLSDKTRIGLRVVDPRSGQVLVSRGADAALTPASNTKIFTGAAIYDRLGPDHELVTEFHAGGPLSEGVVDGDLLVTGGGDPTVSGRFFKGEPMAAMAEVARSLKAAGLRDVRGDLVAAPGPFSGPRRGENWPRDPYHMRWMVDVVALPFNDNQITLRCLPRGEKAEVKFDPALAFGQIRNRLNLTPSKSRHRVVVMRKDKESVFTVSGALWSRGQGYSQDFNVADGALYYLAALREALRIEGIEVAGEVRRGGRRPGANDRLVYRRTTPISRVVPVMLKRSQNLYAELLFRELGRVAGPAGSFVGATTAMNEWLGERSIRRSNTRLVDGSGLSRSNEVSADQITAMLAHLDRRGELGRRLREALAHPGETGTLRKRMKNLQGRVCAKTGTLNGISALSGYARCQDGGWLCFSVLCNRTSVGAARGAQDRICRALCAFGQAAAPLKGEATVGASR